MSSLAVPSLPCFDSYFRLLPTNLIRIGPPRMGENLPVSKLV